jgi:hypothetical protein
LIVSGADHEYLAYSSASRSISASGTEIGNPQAKVYRPQREVGAIRTRGLCGDGSLKVGPNNLNYVLGRFLGGVRIFRHVVDDVIFHEFTHQAVDGPAGSSKTPKNFRALFVIIQSFKDRLELSDDFFGSIHQIQLFSRGMRHFA